MATSYGRTSKTKKRKPKPAAGFGGGLGQALVRQRQTKKKGSGARAGTTRPASAPAITPPTNPTFAADTTPQQQTGSAGSYDPSSDPAVAAAAGLAAKIRAQAQATALAKRKQAAIEYGDPSGVEGLDEATIKAAKENPFSILKQQERAYTTGVGELEEGLNTANLFYSGYRGKQLGEAATGYQQNRYTAGTNFRGVLSGVGDQLAEALMRADELEYNAMLGSDGGYYDPGSDAYGSYDPNYSLANRYRGMFGTKPTYNLGRKTPKPKPKPKPPPRRRFGGGGKPPVRM